MTDRLDEFLRTHEFPGRVIFAKVWGSHSHNTNLPTSDVDYLAVYVAPNERLLSLSPPPETVDGQKPDFQAHEAAKFCSLLLKGNPGIVEMLFTERMCFETDDWRELKEHRRKFLTQQAVTQYLGYCEGQLKKLAHHGGKGGLHTKGGNYNEKWAYHLLRLLGDAKRIAQGGEPVVWKEGGERDLLMRVRAGELSPDEVERLADRGMDEIESMKPWPIPEQGDRAFLERWLLRRRGLA